MNTLTLLESPAVSEAFIIPPRRSIEEVTAPLNELAERSRYIVSRSSGRCGQPLENDSLPRYVFIGPKGGGDTIRLGIFAAIHGDEPEGAYAATRFLRLLEQNPEIAKGYALFFYPVCNPTGFENNTRHSESGKDLNREFWRDSSEPEVRYLESEIYLHAFDGIITLHGDDTSDGLYGLVGGSVLSENLLEPALRSAEQFLPRNRRSVIDGFKAHEGIINDGYEGMLKHVPNLHRPPFEITFETPQKAPSELQIQAFMAALQRILIEYQKLISIGQNI